MPTPQRARMTFSKPINQIELHILVKQAEARFTAKRMRFTPLREQVFRIIARHQAHIGAYAIIAKVTEQTGRKSPVSIYRALEALIRVGAVGRISSKSAYFVSRSIANLNAEPTEPVMLCCNSCGRVVNTASNAVMDAVRQVSAAANFQISAEVVEVCGICHDCASAAAEAARKPRRLRADDLVAKRFAS